MVCKKELYLKDRVLCFENPAIIMGIVNCTPDSFYNQKLNPVDLAKKQIDEGADLLDLGAESTRPGSEYVSEEEELNRLMPVIKEIRKNSNIPVSIDTRKTNVMKAMYEEGADILNDVSALEDSDIDGKNPLAEFAAETKIPVILMHKRGVPSTMQKNTSYDDVVSEVSAYLSERVLYAKKFGIEDNKIWLDPGIGFAKDLEENKKLIASPYKLCGGKYPVLMALSRKICIGQMTGKSVEERESGTLAADLLSVLKGASMLRVHDVASCRDTMSVLKSFIESSLIEF